MNNPNLGGASREEYGGKVEEQIDMAKKQIGTDRTPEQWAELKRAAGVGQKSIGSELLGRLNRGE
jgi:hypothetical protein